MAGKGRGVGESIVSPRRVRATEKHKRALELRIQGVSIQKIADELGYKTYFGAKNAIEVGLKKTLRPAADKFRALESERIDALMAEMWKYAFNSEDIPKETMEIKKAAIETIHKLMGRRAALLGLDMPKAIAPTNPEGTEPYSQASEDQILERITGALSELE